MGHKLSAVAGVKDPENLFQQGNAINEIWFGKFEIISHLPFTESDLTQAGWPGAGLPNIPWHNFIIPLKRAAKRWVSTDTIVPAIKTHHQDVLAPAENLSLVSSTNEADFWKVIYVVIIVSMTFCVALAVPLFLRQHTPIYQSGMRFRRKPKEVYGVGALIATVFLFVGLVYIVPIVRYYNLALQLARDKPSIFTQGAYFTSIVVLCLKATIDVASLWLDYVRANNDTGSEFKGENVSDEDQLSA